MYCPSCLKPNESEVASCAHCQADLEGLSERVFVGAQFVFASASEKRHIALALDDADPQILTTPTIISRHLHAVNVGDLQSRAGLGSRQETAPELAPAQPRLPTPAGPDLTAVITERKIYRPREQARVFVLSPGAPGGEVEMEVQLAGQQITKDRVTLDEAGLTLRPLSDLEEGEYRVLVRQADGSGGFGVIPVECTFSVAEFALSPLTALLVQHRFVERSLLFRLRLLALSVPFEGTVELGLQCEVCGGRVVATAVAMAQQGIVDASFDIGGHGGPFHVQITTPGGETASVFFPGTERTERERVTLCTLGRKAEAGLLPGEDTGEVRGLHVGYGGAQTTPLRLDSAVGQTGRLTVDTRAMAVQVVTFDPRSGDSIVLHFGTVSRGDSLEFPVAAPYTLFTVALLDERRAYEAWGIVIRPLDLQARLSAPATASPGAEITVQVESVHPASCLLLAYDARLEHESPVPKLAKQMIDAMRLGTGDLMEQDAPPLSYRTPPGVLGADRGATDMPAFVRRRVGAPRIRPTMFMAEAPVVPGAALFQAAVPWAPVAVEPETPTFVAVPNREDFPELAYLELFAVRDSAERTVRLGDQIGTWRCRAYMVAGLDVQELTADIEAAKAVYAELDLPASVSPGDDIVASVRYHTDQPATLTITLPGGQKVSGAVMGHGAEDVHLTEPGEITAHLWGSGGEDWTVRTVPQPGVQTVTVSQLDILMRGQTVRAERVVVFPGPGYVLAETIEALGRYPFG
jgi:hypothetical protein